MRYRAIDLYAREFLNTHLQSPIETARKTKSLFISNFVIRIIFFTKFETDIK